ncbi:DNA mismatch endonuclease Vsr [Agrobacterium rubi]|nr:DNA mismatch endonuclease Vsr [Agrobacterium rubi]NTF24630.1 DNA mismatch endonuclease Vsr [Agrobacterium rubi]
MTDVFTPEKRSWVMSRIGGKDTKPEMRVRKAAHAMGLRYRLHRKDLPGRPDLVFPSRGVALFVHGCFWHRHEGCRLASTPSTNVEFWRDKFERNVQRDQRSSKLLIDEGWQPSVIWECETRKSADLPFIICERVLSQPRIPLDPTPVEE